MFRKVIDTSVLFLTQGVLYKMAQKLAHFVRLITSSNIDQFSNIFLLSESEENV